ncbi:hypothetical protein D0863_06119 [Hortaea werneckii]|uniref:Uncharacterized protein n=1 Tax=Hortaea werneckii TaxID=91943 RepID=A0A3M7DZT9_HORWE|nr:hypothetical protein D0863_06119 [Hortaea werneckii]
MVFFCFTCGPHTFQSLLKGYENITVQCQNCGNFSGKIVKRWEWFTFCFSKNFPPPILPSQRSDTYWPASSVPVIPFSLKPDHDVHCHICRFNQDIKFRPDVQQQMDGGGGNIPMQNQGGQQGWGPQGPPHQYK